MNYNLAYNSIGFYQISKLFCIPTTLIIESIFGLRQQELTYQLLGSLIIILTGMCLVVEQEISIKSNGIIWTVAAVVTTSAAQIFFAQLL